MRHVHERKNDNRNGAAICFVNIMLFLPDATDEEIDVANRAQAAQEAKLRRSLDSLSYSETDTLQAEGPLAQFLIPVGCKRNGDGNSFPLWKEAMKDQRVAREVDFAALRTALSSGFDEADDEDIPLDVLSRIWGCSRSVHL